MDYLLKPFTIEEVEACLKKVRSELEKSEIADWSRKTAAKQLLEMALREKQETELLRKISVVYLEKNWKSAGLES